MAEDNLANQQVIALMLEALGCAADVANNGIEVLKTLDQKSYDVIFMDMQMPELKQSLLRVPWYDMISRRIPKTLVAFFYSLN